MNKSHNLKLFQCAGYHTSLHCNLMHCQLIPIKLCICKVSVFTEMNAAIVSLPFISQFFKLRGAGVWCTHDNISKQIPCHLYIPPKRVCACKITFIVKSYFVERVGMCTVYFHSMTGEDSLWDQAIV